MSSKKDGADEMSRETYFNNSPIFLGSSFLDENDQKIYLEDDSGDYFD